MEAEASSTNYLPKMVIDILPAVTPVLLVTIGYIDPGKWAACIDSGARFGGDLAIFMLAFNFVAILCQYLSARVGVITGRNLAQICREEYDKPTCVILGIQAELSMILLDLTTVLGIAHGLNMIFGVDFFTSILLTALNALIYPIFSILLENPKTKLLVACLAGLTLLCYILGTLFGQPEFSVFSNDVLSKLSGESAFALMSLLGASIMPHDFYLHSSLVQRYKGPQGAPGGPLSHDNFFTIFAVFSGIFLVKYALMNAGAHIFHSSGLVLLTFQDVISLMDQAFRSPVAPLFFILVMLFASQITAVSWELGEESGKTVLHEFFGIDLPGWLHCATIRIFAVVPALHCLWSSGAEGMYQMLIVIQVLTALLFPSSVIPLVRIASSRHIMGLHKISPMIEFISLITFMGIMGLKIMFMVEMIFGDSDWVGNLHWNMGIISVPYVILLVTALVSLCLVLWLVATPLKSASATLDEPQWKWDTPQFVPKPYTERHADDVNARDYLGEEILREEEPVPSSEKPSGSHSHTPVKSYDFDLPETIMDTLQLQEPHLPTIEENFAVNTSSSLPVDPPEHTPPTVVSASLPNAGDTASETVVPLKEKTIVLVEMRRTEDELSPNKNDEDGCSWEPEDSSKWASATDAPSTSDGPGSFRSISGKSEDGGTAPGSLSRLSGLGRAARRQMAAILDEFWGQLFDFHGQVTKDAKARNLGLVLSIESKPSQNPTRSDSIGKDYGGSMQFVGSRGSDSSVNTSLYNSSSQTLLQSNMASVYGAQRGSSSLWSSQLQSLEAYVQNCRNNALNGGERRYSSLRLPPSTESLDYQPATIHGCQISSYMNQLARERSHYLNGQLDSAPSRSQSLGMNNYSNPYGLQSLRPKLSNGPSSLQTSGLPSPTLSINDVRQPDNVYFDLSSGSGDTLGQNNTKKYHSLPDISGITLPLRTEGLQNIGPKWGGPNASMGLSQAVGRTNNEQYLSSTTGSRPLTFDDVSPSNSLRDVFPSGLGPGSLWSEQPFERFGVANKAGYVGSNGIGAGNRSNFAIQKASPVSDASTELLKSLRECILKLLKLEGSEWLFRQNDGVDEDLIVRVAQREMFLLEAESSDRESILSLRGDDSRVSSVPQCGDACIWKVDLVVSFGVWCIHRVLELSLMESRPELWGKYTYVLNRLQGIVELAFFKPRTPNSLCFCVHVPVTHQQRFNPSSASNGQLPPPPGFRIPMKGKFTTGAMMLEVIKDVEIAISCRKGRSGTAAGDVAFPKGKENLASVLKRYKRRLSNKPVGNNQEGGSGSRRQLN